MFRDRQRGLDHVEIMDTGRIDLAKFTRQEIRLLLIIPLYIDIVTGMQNRFQKSDRIFRVNNLSFC